EISDNGPGIMEQDQARIFDPFFTRKPDGTGLGLSISRQILERHGAYIELDSSLDRGTTFRIIFPLTQNHMDDRGGSGEEHKPGMLQVDEEISRHGLH
ncbi:MAG: ATP-binding protein, partial [Desulfoferrobacter sp.]